FFFQAEDGIRDRNVTGVQTCALPIYDDRDFAAFKLRIEIGGIGKERVLHVDRAAAVVFVFYFSLGKRRLVGDAPVDGLAPAVDEIGRASCRGRGGGCGGRGGVSWSCG